jgi:hypothetical protein
MDDLSRRNPPGDTEEKSSGAASCWFPLLLNGALLVYFPGAFFAAFMHHPCFFQGEAVRIPVIPAQAGIQKRRGRLDSSLCGNDGQGNLIPDPQQIGR